MRHFQKELLEACADLGLKIYLDHKIKLPDSQEIIAPVLLPELGGTQGIIIVGTFNEALAIEKLLKQNSLHHEYGFSCLSDDLVAYHKESTIRMFSEWGWSGPADQRPSWMINIPDDEE